MNKIYFGIALALVILGAFAFFLNRASKEATTQKQDAVSTTTNTMNTRSAIIKTNYGDITLELFAIEAPGTVENFVKLAGEGFYDGVKFHRTIPGFMIQGGDPLTRDDSAKERWGTGGPGYTFADEIYVSNRNDTGTIAMANAGLDTNGSQFFINVADNNFLDQKHTVFGRVTNGMDVVRAIESVETEGPDRPVEPVVIESVTVSN
jgi:cyclophilin family peptidyl-prolyl cis-trans isomerase